MTGAMVVHVEHQLQLQAWRVGDKMHHTAMRRLYSAQTLLYNLPLKLKLCKRNVTLQPEFMARSSKVMRIT